jgi:hypothetical protein
MDLATTIIVLVQGFGILAALGGVYSQLRLSRQTAQNDIYQSNVGAYNQFIGSMASSSDLNSIFTRGRHSPDSLSEAEKERFFMLCVQYFGFHENLYIQYERRGFPREIYDGWSVALQKNLHQAGFLAYWKEQGDEYTASFQRQVERLAAKPLKNNGVRADSAVRADSKADLSITRTVAGHATSSEAFSSKPGP